MDSILKVLSIAIILVGLAFAGFWFFAKSFLEKKVQDQIVSQIQPHVDSFEVGKLKLISVFPLKASLEGVTLTKSGFKLEKVNKFTVGLGLADPIWNVFTNSLMLTVNVENYIASLEGSEKEGESRFLAPFKGLKNSKVFSLPFDLKIQSTNGIVGFLSGDPNVDTSLSQLNFEVRRSDLDDPDRDWSLQVDGAYNYVVNGVAVVIPISIQSDDLLLNVEKLKSQNLKVSISGLPMTFSGESNLQLQTHEWNSSFSIADLSKMQNVDFLPSGSWKGSVAGSVVLQKKENALPYLGVSLKTSLLQGDLDYQNGEFAANGPASGQFEFQMSYQKFPMIRKLQGFLNLDSAEVTYGQLLAKPRNIPLNAQYNVTYEKQILGFRHTKLNFHKLRSILDGVFNFNLDGNSQGVVRIEPTNLNGFEKYIPFASTYPMTGTVAMESEVRGSLNNFESVYLNVKNYELTEINAVLKYRDDNKNILVDGPLAVSSKGRFILYKNNFQGAQANFTAVADNMELRLGNNFYKERGKKARGDAVFEQTRRKVSIKKSRIILPGLDLGLTGTVDGFDKPELNVDASIYSLDTKVLAKTLPYLSHLNFESQLFGQLRAVGTYDSSVRPLAAMPIVLSGKLSARVKDYKLNFVVAEEAINEGETTEGVPLVPEYPLLKKSNLDLSLFVENFYFNDYLLKGVNLKNDFSKGEIKSSGSISDFYGGKVNISNSVIDLRETLPVAIVLMDGSGVRLQDLVALHYPDLAQNYRGEWNFKLKAKIPYPQNQSWRSELRAKGTMGLSNAFIPSFQFQSLSRQKLSSLHGIGVPETQSQNPSNPRLKVTSEFTLQKEKFRVRNFNVNSSEGDELTGDGVVDFFLSTSMQGRVYLTNPPVRGDVFEANKDKKNRIVVPLNIKGSLVSPTVSFSRDTIDSLLATAIRYRSEKTKLRAEQELRRQASEEKKKQMKKQKGKGVLFETN